MAKRNENSVRDEENSFGIHCLVSLALIFICSIISRAPTLADDLTVVGIGVRWNVGYVITLAPLLFLAIATWLFWRSGAVIEVRQDAGKKPIRGGSRWALLALFLMPAVGCLFLLRQFVFEITEPGVGCGSFDRLKMFLAWPLGPGWRFEYCNSGLTPEVQRRMPYIWPPVQTWGYVAVVLMAVWLGITTWARLTTTTIPNLALAFRAGRSVRAKSRRT
jgi:hypothetical protein